MSKIGQTTGAQPPFQSHPPFNQVNAQLWRTSLRYEHDSDEWPVDRLASSLYSLALCSQACQPFYHCIMKESSKTAILIQKNW